MSSSLSMPTSMAIPSLQTLPFWTTLRSRSVGRPFRLGRILEVHLAKMDPSVTRRIRAVLGHDSGTMQMCERANSGEFLRWVVCRAHRRRVLRVMHYCFRSTSTARGFEPFWNAGWQPRSADCGADTANTAFGRRNVAQRVHGEHLPCAGRARSPPSRAME